VRSIQPPIQWVQCRHQVDHSLPSSSKLKVWSYSRNWGMPSWHGLRQLHLYPDHSSYLTVSHNYIPPIITIFMLPICHYILSRHDTTHFNKLCIKGEIFHSFSQRLIVQCANTFVQKNHIQISPFQLHSVATALKTHLLNSCTEQPCYNMTLKSVCVCVCVCNNMRK
jgi:hypothetical protein